MNFQKKRLQFASHRSQMHICTQASICYRNYVLWRHVGWEIKCYHQHRPVSHF